MAIMRLLAEESVSLADVASRFGVQKSSLHRCLQNHQPRAGRAQKPSDKPAGATGRTKGSSPSRSVSETADGRCSACGQLTTDAEALEPKALVRRAERLLNLAEGIALRAEADNDSRLCLMSLDRAQRSLDSLLKVAGLLGPDVQVNVDARQQNIYASWPTESLHAIQTMHDALNDGKSVQDAIEAVLGHKEAPMLSAPGPEDTEAA